MPGLQFNNITNRELGLIQDCEDRLNFPANGISGNTNLLAQFTRYINIRYQKVVTMIFDSQDDWDWDDSNQTAYPIATTDIVANQQDYSLPVSLNIMKIEKIDVSYDGGATWRRAIPFQPGETYLPTDSVTVANNFQTTRPFYDIRDNAIFLYPTPTQNSTAGLKIWFYRGPLEFATSDTTKQPGIDTPFHAMLSIGAALDYAEDKSLPQADRLAKKFDDYEVRLRNHYGTKDEDRRYILKTNNQDFYYE